LIFADRLLQSSPQTIDPALLELAAAALQPQRLAVS
jgi:hypothetical protein